MDMASVQMSWPKRWSKNSGNTQWPAFKKYILKNRNTLFSSSEDIKRRHANHMMTCLLFASSMKRGNIPYLFRPSLVAVSLFRAKETYYFRPFYILKPKPNPPKIVGSITTHLHRIIKSSLICPAIKLRGRIDVEKITGPSCKRKVFIEFVG